MIHAVLFAVWIVWNTQAPERLRFDPYPFNFLTMCVSLEAIFLSVFVLLSQNRQAAKDRVRADIEYDVNLRAELEVAQLHEKIDQLNADVLARLDQLSGQQSAHPTEIDAGATGSGGRDVSAAVMPLLFSRLPPSEVLPVTGRWLLALLGLGLLPSTLRPAPAAPVMQKNLVYGQAGGIDLKLDLYQPDRSTLRRSQAPTR